MHQVQDHIHVPLPEDLTLHLSPIACTSAHPCNVPEIVKHVWLEIVVVPSVGINNQKCDSGGLEAQAILIICSVVRSEEESQQVDTSAIELALVDRESRLAGLQLVRFYDGERSTCPCSGF